MASVRKAFLKHFKWRLRCRHRIKITAKEYDELIKAIEEPSGEDPPPIYPSRQHEARHLQRILVGDKQVPVVYDNKYKLLVTALPWGAYTRNKRLHKQGLVAQGSEQSAHNRLVAGSNPAEPTNFSLTSQK